MSTETTASRFDTAKWIVVVVLLAVAVVGNSYYADQSLLYRVLGILALAVVAGLVALQTAKGAAFWALVKGSRTEIRKVVWPTMLVVWFLTGLWHGAAWNFALWGTYFGVLMIMEKAFLREFLYRLPQFARHAYLLFAVLVSWTLFELGSLDAITEYLSMLFGLDGSAFANDESLYVLRSNAVLFAVAIVGSMPVLRWVRSRIGDHSIMQPVVIPIAQAVLLVVTWAYLVDSTFSPFLYFRF